MSTCGLCLGADAPTDAADPRLRAIVRDLFSFWPDDVAVVACSDCFRTIEDFYAFYERVRENQLTLRAVDSLKEACQVDGIKVEEEMPVKAELWDDDHVVVKKESDMESDESSSGSEDDDDEASVASTPPSPPPRKKYRSRKVADSKKSEKEDNSNTFPTELIRDGKFVVSKNVLNNMASGFYNIQCGECKNKFDKLSQMLRHYVSVHGGRPFVECCSKKIYRTEFMYQHMAKHLQPTAFQCSICNKEFARIQVLKEHLGLHVPEEKRIHRCDKCNRGFGYKSLLTRHMIRHIPENEKKTYKCDHCPKTFDNYVTRNNHVRTHSSLKFLCPECGKSFREKQQLSRHLEIHSGDKHKCEICGALCKTNNTMRNHMKLHSDVRFNCQYCKFTSHIRGMVRHHMSIKHSDEKPHVCDMCGKQFKLKTGLQTHMAQHTGERKYCCPHCPKTFASSGNFSKHRKRMHDDEAKNAVAQNKI